MVAGPAQAAVSQGSVPQSSAAQAGAAPQHGPSWVAGYFRDFGSCQAAGRQGQWRHSWGRYECQRAWDNSYGGDHHGDGHDGHRHLDSSTWILTVWR